VVSTLPAEIRIQIELPRVIANDRPIASGGGPFDHQEGRRVAQHGNQAVRIHPLVVRITHWINALAILIMVASGWRIYNASPLFGFRFPNDWTLGGWLAGALQWHFAAMWLVAAAGLVYVTYGVASGHFRRKLLPVTPAAVWRDIAAALRGKLAHGDLRAYNVAQRGAYLGVIAIAFLLVLSGLVLWKPVQFHALGLFLGDYEGARYVHFFAMAALVLFVIIHVAMVVLVPRTFPPMFTGRIRVPDASRSG
jgi:thiosulfate reductase cytochrome b subunit